MASTVCCGKYSNLVCVYFPPFLHFSKKIIVSFIYWFLGRSILGYLPFLDALFCGPFVFLVLSMCVLVVASDFSRYFLVLVVFSTGYQLMYPWCTVSINVQTSGIKYVSCKYSIKFHMLVDFRAKLHCALRISFTFAMWIGPYYNGILHRPIRVS